ncbi:MAG TPA: M23 family metallopeptidase [Actinomycetota bacterium]|nr:M23 family metallopeptidase [Actinomycetota bacterium]
MRKFAKIALFVTLLGAQQGLGAPVGVAQVDPCHPVPIPELCETLDPSPSPDPSPPGGGKGGGGGNGGSGGGQQGGGDGQGGDVGDGSRKKGAKPKAAKGAPERARFRLGGTNDTSRLMAILERMAPRVPVRRSVLEVVGPFPVAGLAYWANDWHACRDGCDRLHKGLDIFAKEGTPLVAVSDGVVSQKLVGDLSGISVEITDQHGIQYFYAHLSKWAPGIRVGQRVERGDVIGFVGHTGNAIYTPDHVHFEVQPGGIPVPPKPFVDRWLEVAEQRALELVAAETGTVLARPSDFRLTRLFDLGGGGAADAGTGELLALAGFQPSVSSLEIARRLLAQMAWEIDWTGRADADLARLVEEYGRILEDADLSGASPWSPLGELAAERGDADSGD